MKKEKKQLSSGMPDVYHFVKYDSQTTIQHILKKSESGAVLCFDFEDSAFDWINEKNSSQIKSDKRNTLLKLLCSGYEELNKVKLGFRINSPDTDELTKDIAVLSLLKNIHTVFIPKINTTADYKKFSNCISAQNINCKEIIPVIETKKGIDALQNLLKSFHEIKKVCFGHCDYNKDMKIFPFFHQDALEYWKWVDRILELIKPYKVKFINSPYLKLNDPDFFRSILSHLNFTTDGWFGQITLNSSQTKCCTDFEGKKFPINGIAKDRHNLKVEKNDLVSLINKFENENSGKAFTISETNTIISPQEYCTAKYLLNNYKNTDLNITFAGGCFPVQHNILFEDTFHRILKIRSEELNNLNLHFRIIRYEKFSNCLDKIIGQHEIHPIDNLVFHIRAEPFLRLVKLFYRYQDYEYKKHWSLNLPFRKRSDPEKYDMLFLARRYIYSEEKKKSLIRKILIDMNYFSGLIAGNKGNALKRYLHLVNSVIDFCAENRIRLFILGPAIRSNTYIEHLISVNLENYFSRSLTGMKDNYIFGLDKHVINSVRYFNRNGTHATERYHELIASRLYEKIVLPQTKSKSKVKS